MMTSAPCLMDGDPGYGDVLPFKFHEETEMLICRLT